MIDFYCIHKEDDADSQEPLNDAIKSGKQFGINVIPFPGVYSNINKKLNEENLFVNRQGSHKITRRGNGVIGCFLSHFYLWKKCVEENTPIGILEYDAIFIKPLNNKILDSFEDYLNLDFTRHAYLQAQSNGEKYLEQIKNESNNKTTINTLNENTKAKDKNLIKYLNNNHIKGAFGYIIKPSGAKKLIGASKTYGILPADIQINLAYCDVKYVSPSIVMLNPKGLKNRFSGSHTNHDKTE